MAMAHTHVTMRPYTGLADLAAMLALLRVASAPFAMYPTAADLPEVLDPAVSDTPAHTVVWEDAEGTLVSFAIVSHYNNLHFHFRAGLPVEVWEHELLDWAMRQPRNRTGNTAETRTLDAAAFADDTATTGVLRRGGFAPAGQSTLRMARSLHDPLPDPRLPPGFTIRRLAGEAEVPAYVALHRAAYGSENMTVELRLSIMRQAHYRPELDLVVVAPDGALAAFGVCMIDASENERTGRNEGEIAIVGTHPAFRRRGLGQAMVLAGMSAMRRAGIAGAFLTVADGNTVAIRVYEAAGFRTQARMDWYTRTLDV